MLYKGEVNLHFDPPSRHSQWHVQKLREGGAKLIACEACTQKFSHTPKTLTMQSVLEDGWLTKKAVFGQVAMRNCCFESEF